MAREADLVLPTHAGPEIGVASTKAFTCQLGVLAAFAANLARARGRLDAAEEKRIVNLLAEVPAAMTAALAHDAAIEEMAPVIAKRSEERRVGKECVRTCRSRG